MSSFLSTGAAQRSLSLCPIGLSAFSHTHTHTRTHARTHAKEQESCLFGANKNGSHTSWSELNRDPPFYGLKLPLSASRHGTLFEEVDELGWIHASGHRSDRPVSLGKGEVCIRGTNTGRRPGEENRGTRRPCTRPRQRSGTHSSFPAWRGNRPQGHLDLCLLQYVVYIYVGALSI